MNVSVGFAMRISDFPLAVAIPPAPEQLAVTTHSRDALIEARAVSESPAISASLSSTGGQMPKNHAKLQHHGLTYTRSGAPAASVERSGFLIDTYI